MKIATAGLIEGAEASAIVFQMLLMLLSSSIMIVFVLVFHYLFFTLKLSKLKQVLITPLFLIISKSWYTVKSGTLKIGFESLDYSAIGLSILIIVTFPLTKWLLKPSWEEEKSNS